MEAPRAGLRSSFEEKTTLHYSSEGGHLDNVKLLISEGLSVNASGLHRIISVRYAARIRNSNAESVVKYLIKKGAGVKSATWAGELPIRYTADNNNGRSLLSLLRDGSNVHQRDERDGMLLHKLAWDCDLPGANTLVGEGTEIKPRSNTDTSVLHCAAEAAKVDKVK